jgi:transketolase
VREFGMAAIMNGIALHGGYLPYGGTFLTFSDYSRNAIRMAALMKRRVIHVFTHDSIGLGEDGPTHQSVEHAAALALIPGLDVWRPADTAETAVAWACAIETTTARRALLLSRQNLPYAPKAGLDDIAAAPTCWPSRPRSGLQKKAQAVIIATGSEVQLALHAQQQLAVHGIAVRVVSMPSTTVFDRQDAAYKRSVLPPACRASRSRPASPTAGGSTAARRSWASTPTASRRPAACCSSTSTSRPTTSPPRCSTVLRG